MQMPPLTEQADKLISLGLAKLGGFSAAQVRRAIDGQSGDDALLVVHQNRIPASTLAALMSRDGKPGFVVTDMTDVDLFEPIEQAQPPDHALYVLTGLSRGDDMANWSPDEALPVMVASGRTPLLLNEGIQWLLHQPRALQPNYCFMTIGSRLRKPNSSLDKRTPAIWISGGTGRDGLINRGAPKVGWCWAGNRHTWLGFASAAERHPLLE